MMIHAPAKAFGLVAASMASVSLFGIVSASIATSWVDAAGPLIGAIAAGIGTVLTIRQRRSEIRISDVEQQNKDRHQWVDQIQEQLDHEIRNSTELRVLFNRMYRILLDYHYGTRQLAEQISALGLSPAWQPPSDDEIESLMVSASRDRSGD